jgi:hypothetical protein
MPIITKADGTTEEYDPKKLVSSLRRAGATDSLISNITEEVEKSIGEGTTTSELYYKAFQLLRGGEHVSAARYAIRKAVLELGPSGFPFERFVAEIFRARGYTADHGVMLKGKCVEHEVDLVATKDGIRTVAELKFHNEAGYKTDVKVALYIHARFEDLKKASSKHESDIPLLITNTKFTQSAIEYGNCVGLSLIGWTYPHTGNLQDLIQETRMYPVTVLTSLSNQEKKMLIEADAGLCSAVAKDADVLGRVGIPKESAEKAFEESRALCGL